MTYLSNGRWWDARQGTWRDGCGRRVRGLPPPAALLTRELAPEGLGPAPLHLPVTRVVLAGCHLDHDPSNNKAPNLAALCQRCHMLHDAPVHGRTRGRRAFRGRAAGNLFGGAP